MKEALVTSKVPDMEKEMATHSSILTWKNHMVRGVWWATIHRVAKNQTQLKQLSTQSPDGRSLGPCGHDGAKHLCLSVQNPGAPGSHFQP